MRRFEKDVPDNTENVEPGKIRLNGPVVPLMSIVTNEIRAHRSQRKKIDCLPPGTYVIKMSEIDAMLLYH